MTEQTPEENCVVRAVAWLSNETIAETIAFFDAYHGARDWFDGGANLEAYALALIDGRRWRPLIPKAGEPCSIPSRALVTVPGHAFAIADGKIFDTALGCSRDGDGFICLIPPDPVQ